MPWNVLKYDTEKEGYVVPLTKAKLDAAPRYAEGEVPDYTDVYNTKVNSYYGIDR